VRCEAARARRQYDAIELENRIVAAELERRWNEALKVVAQLQSELDAPREQATHSQSAAARDKMLRLSDELPRFWQHPKSSIGIKKRILRTVLREIVVAKHDDTISAAALARQRS
jgi:hypothetical protein